VRARHRRGASTLVRLLLALPIALSCEPLDDGRRHEVIARLAAAEGASTDPPAATEPVKLAQSTRHAVPLLANTQRSFEVSTERSARRIVFSIGARGGDPGSAAVFSIERRSGDAWQPVFRQAVDSNGVWSDHRVDLPAGSRHFRFVTEPREPATHAGKAFWGSVSFTAPEPATPADPHEPPPNVILVSLDTLGAAYLGSFGHVSDASPAIDAFLADGFSFRRAFAQYPATLGSHATLFTGLYPLHHGFYGMTSRRLPSLVETFAGRGYRTAAFTENAFVGSDFGFSTGFDRYEDGVGEGAALHGQSERTFRDAEQWLADAGRDTRFFLFVHTYEVHSPYTPRDADAQALADRLTPGDTRSIGAAAMLRHNRGEQLLDEAAIDRLEALHAGEIQYLDRIVGGFFERLRELGLDDDTIVVLTADHGDLFGEQGRLEHGGTLHNRVLHVPLAFRWPGRIEAGVSNDPVQLADVLPTLLELAELGLPDRLDGRSLAGALRGDGTAPPARPAFSETDADDEDCKIRGGCELSRVAVQTGRFKLVVSLTDAGEALYDLEADPLETRDVSSQHPEELQRHRAMIAGYLESATPASPAKPGPALDDETRRRLRALGYID